MSECQVIATEIVDASDRTKYLCELCNVSFSKRSNLNRHLRKFHQLQVLGQANQACPLCDEKFPTIIILNQHLENQHSVRLKYSDETFYSEKDFQDWKSKFEKENLSSFILRNTRRSEDGITTFHYVCHRSGNYKFKQNRVRRVKSSGSVKSGRQCPASIKAVSQTIDGISEIKVQYQSVHLGHDLDIRFLRLSKEERENLAACLKLGIPMNKILEEARQNNSPTNRYRLLTRKHLHNIRVDLGIPLNSEKKLQNKSAFQSAEIEASDSSIDYEDYVEIEVSSHEESQEQEINTAISSLLLLQKNDQSEEFNKKRMQIINPLKELLTRIEKWDPQCPLPDIEEHIKAINARLDMSASSNNVVHPILTVAPTNKPVTKRRRITKKVSKKSKLN